MSKTVSFITENFDKYDPSSIESYLSIGGFTRSRKHCQCPPVKLSKLQRNLPLREEGRRL
jgi:hypothetical protein